MESYLVFGTKKNSTSDRGIAVSDLEAMVHRIFTTKWNITPFSSENMRCEMGEGQLPGMLLLPLPVPGFDEAHDGVLYLLGGIGTGEVLPEYLPR